MIIGKLDEMILEYQRKWGFKPKAIMLTSEQMLELQVELLRNPFFGLEVVNIFPSSRIVNLENIKV